MSEQMPCNTTLDALLDDIRAQYQDLFERHNLWPKIAGEVPEENLAVTHSLEVLLYRATRLFDEWKKANREVFEIWEDTPGDGLLTLSMHFRYAQYELWDFIVRSKTALDFTTKVLHPLFKGPIPCSIGQVLRKLKNGVSTDCPFYMSLRDDFLNQEQPDLLSYTVDFRDFLSHAGVFIYAPQIDVCNEEHFELNKDKNHTRSATVPPQLVILGDSLEQDGLPIHLPNAIRNEPLDSGSGFCTFRYTRPLQDYVRELLITIFILYDEACTLADSTPPRTFTWG